MLPFELISPVKNYLWGGTKLKSIFGKGDGSEEIISESWELSCRADGMCTVKDGCFAGETLENVLKKKSVYWRYCLQEIQGVPHSRETY